MITPKLKFWSLFSGIGGFDEAFRRAGMECVLRAEIDGECRSVMEGHHPGVETLNDVLRLRAYLEPKNAARFARQFVRPDLICGGFPCQDLSVAGKRAGLAGERSGLWYVFRRVIALVRPRWVCIENVLGLLSSNDGRDMGILLWALGKLGYGWAYRVLDAQWFGVAQRRRRVLIVGCLGNATAAGEVLFERDSLPWDSAPSREAKPGVAGTIDAGSGVRRGAGINPGTITGCLNSGGNSGGFRSEPGEHLVPARATWWDGGDISQCIDAVVAKGQTMPEKDRFPAVLVPTAFQERGREGGRTLESQENLAYSLMAPNGGGRRQENCVAYQQAAWVLHSENSTAGRSGVPPKQVETARCLDQNGGFSANQGGNLVSGPLMAVRRLTPRECERLQGFPDDWTRYGHDGREISDSARYRMLGNAVCVNVAEWIGRRIMECG